MRRATASDQDKPGICFPLAVVAYARLAARPADLPLHGDRARMPPATSHVLLNLFVLGYGYHEASWKVSGLEHPGRLGLDHFAEVARTARRGAPGSAGITWRRSATTRSTCSPRWPRPPSTSGCSRPRRRPTPSPGTWP